MLNKALFATAASAAIMLSSQASAVQLQSLENVPPQYARMVEVEIEGTDEVKEELQYGSTSYIWKADSLNRILTGYGLELTPENADGAPKDFCKTIEVTNEDGEVEQQMVFNKVDSTIYTPNSLNTILNAYGVSLDIENEEAMASLPSAFARVVEQEKAGGEVIKVAVFGGQNLTWNPSSFNTILSAYK